MSDERIDGFRNNVVIAISLYPLVIGLYAAGFFWDLPKDLIGAFDLTEFIFKASIIYAVIIAGGIIPLLLFAVITTLFMQKGWSESRENEETTHETWDAMSTKRKLVFSTASLLMLGFFVYFTFGLFSNVKFGPSWFFAIALGISLFSPVVRPFMHHDSYREGKARFLVASALLFPVLAGSTDAMPSEESPTVTVADEACPVVFLGTEKMIAVCKDSTALVERVKERPLIWRNSEK